MKPKLNCPYARHDAQMMVNCNKLGEPCTHQRWCMSKGWSVLTDYAGRCPARKDDEHGADREAAQERGD